MNHQSQTRILAPRGHWGTPEVTNRTTHHCPLQREHLRVPGPHTLPSSKIHPPGQSGPQRPSLLHSKARQGAPGPCSLPADTTLLCVLTAGDGVSTHKGKQALPEPAGLDFLPSPHFAHSWRNSKAQRGFAPIPGHSVIGTALGYRHRCLSPKPTALTTSRLPSPSTQTGSTPAAGGTQASLVLATPKP